MRVKYKIIKINSLHTYKKIAETRYDIRGETRNCNKKGGT